MSRCEAPSPAPALALVFAEEVHPKTETTSSEDLLRKMIVEKISGAEVVVASMESSIAEKERLIAENRATLAGSREEILNLQKKLAILDSMSGVVPPTKVCEGVTRGWTKIKGHNAYCGSGTSHSDGLREGGVTPEIIEEALEYGGYVAMTDAEAEAARRAGSATWTWVRVQTRDPNKLLNNMNEQPGVDTYISPGASIELIKASEMFFACVWSSEDSGNPLCAPPPPAFLGYKDKKRMAKRTRRASRRY